MVNPRGNIFIEHADGLKQQCSNTIIRNVLTSSKISLVIFIWSFFMIMIILHDLFFLLYLLKIILEGFGILY